MQAFPGRRGKGHWGEGFQYILGRCGLGPFLLLLADRVLSQGMVTAALQELQVEREVVNMS